MIDKHVYEIKSLKIIFCSVAITQMTLHGRLARSCIFHHACSPAIHSEELTIRRSISLHRLKEVSIRGLPMFASSVLMLTLIW